MENTSSSISYELGCGSGKEIANRLKIVGVRSLSDRELIQLSVGALDEPFVAATLLPALDRCDIDALVKADGLTPVQARKLTALCAAFELARRRIRPEGVRISGPRDVLPLVGHLLDRQQEHVVVISLSGAHEVIRVRTVSMGLLTSCPVHPREVFVGPLADRAYAVILAHNHPSGDPTPSDEDRSITEQIRKAGQILGIKLLDHVIFARRGFFSFQSGVQGAMPLSGVGT
jgi:DNA repair protein RadC